MKKLNNQGQYTQNHNLQQKVNTYARKGKLRRIIAILGAFVLFFTMNTLKFQADTLQRIPTCGLEEHIHTEACYDEAGELICGLEAHEHTDACYQQRPVQPEPTVFDEYMDLNSQVVLASPMTVSAEDVDKTVNETTAELGDDVGSADASDNGLEVEYDLEDLYSGNDADVLSDEGANVSSETGADDASDDGISAGAEYVVNGSTAFLSDVLRGVGLEVSGVLAVGEIEDFALVAQGSHINVEPVEGVEDEFVIRVVQDFDRVTLGVETSAALETIDLVNGVAQSVVDLGDETADEEGTVEEAAGEPVEEVDTETEYGRNTNETNDNSSETIETEQKQTEVGEEETEVGEKIAASVADAQDDSAADAQDDVTGADENAQQDAAGEASDALEDETGAQDKDAQDEDEQADGAQVDGEQADGEQADEGAVVAVERRVDLDFTDYVATDDHTVFLYDAELGAVLVNTDEVQTADGVVVTLGSAADEAQDEDATAAAEAGQAEKAALIITGDGEYEQGGVTYAVSGLVLPGETGAQSDEGDGAQDEAAEDTAADDTAVDDTAADETDDGAQSGEGGEAAERRVDLDFTDYIATDEHAVYLYDASMVAVLVNTAEIASVDGVAVGMPEAEAAGDAEQAENDADNADNTDNTENDADRAENDADRAEAEMPADATTVLIITGDGEYALNGTTYAVTGLVLPEKTVGNDNITIATANDEATLLNVAPVFEETDEDYDDIFSLFTAAKDDPTLLAKVVDLLGGVAYAEEDGEAGRELNVKVFNIALQDITTGEAVEPGTELHVETSLEKPIEGENFALYHIADGKAKLIDDAVVVEDGKAVGLNFNTVSLDKFALVYYTVNVTVEEKTITVDVDFTDVVENGVDFDSQTLLTALNDGVAIGVESLLSGDAESALSVNIEGDDLNVDIAALSESFSEGGVSFADGSVKVTGDGSITLTDGTYTLNINVTHYTRLLEMELKAEGVSVEVLDGEVPAGSTVSYEALSDGDTTRLVEEYREIIDTSEASGEAGEADNTEEPEAGAPEEGAEETGDAADQAAEAGDTADETAGEDGAEEAAGEGENTVKTETATGYTAFDVSIAMPEGDAFTEGGQFAVTVDHAVDAASLVPEGAVVDRITYALFHIHEGEATAIDDVTVTDGQVSFTTDSFSEYVIRYTVDFEYIDPETGKTYVWSWPGVGSYTLSDILWMFDVTEPVESATLTRIMDIGGAENCLYLEQKDGEWVLTSETAFHDVFELVVVAGGVEYTIIVTDAGEIDLQTIAKNDSTGIVISESSTPTPDGYSRSSTYSVHLNYAIDNSKLALARANNTWVYDLSSFFNNPDVPFSGFPEGLPQSGPITENNMTKGRYYIQSDKVYFEMNQSFINTHTDITGTLDITLQLDETKVGSKGESEFTFPGTTDELTITYKAVDVSDSWKAVNNNQSGIVAVQEENGNYRLNYTASVRPNAALDSLVMNDTLGAGQTLDKSSFVIKTESGKTYTVPASAIQDTATGFTLDIATVVKAAGDSIKSGTKYEVTYSTKVDADKVDGEHNITNRINWEWEGGSKPTNETDVRPKRATTIDKAVAATDGDGETYIKTLTYTITVGDNNHKDVSGVKVQDYMQDYQLLDGNIVIRDASGSAVYTIADSELKWTNDATFSDNQKALFEYTFPANSNNGPYTITYTTKVPADVGRDGQVNITNRVNTGDGSSDDTGVPVDFGTRPGPGASIDKAFAGWAEKDSDGKVTSNWTIDVNVAADAELPLQNVVVTETDCYTAPSGWYPHTDATVDYTSIVVKDKATGNVIDSYTVDEDAGTITFAKLNGSVTIELSATSTEPMPDAGWFENNASLTVNGKPAGSDKDNRQYGSVTFDKSVSYDKTSEVFTWTVRLNSLRNKVEPDVPVYFSDLLPEGMQLLNYTTGGAENPSIHVSTGGTAYYDWNQDVTVSGREIQRTNITAYTDYGYTTHRDAALSGIDYTITYKTKLTDAELASFANTEDGKKTYLNTAFYYHDETGDADGQATRDVEYEYKIVNKAVKSVSKDIIEYEIEVNPKALQLNGGAEMTLVDTLNTTNIDLLLDTVVIVDDKGNGVVGAAAVYNDDQRTLTVTVPDEMRVFVRYSVIAQNLGEQTFRNTAELHGKRTWTKEDITTRTITQHGATATGSGNVTLQKIDENYDVNPDGSASPKLLSGAKFALYQQPVDYAREGRTVTGDGTFTGEPVRVNRDDETDSTFTSVDGVVLFDGVTIQKYDYLYYWQEVEAPAGYQLDETKHYFVMYDADENKELEDAYKDIADLLDEAATQANPGVIINKIATGASWTVINRTDGLTVEVEKVWKDSTGADKVFEEDKTIYFKLYQDIGDGNPTLYKPETANPAYTHANYLGNGIWKIDYTAADHTWGKASITGLPEQVNGVPCKYFVEEVNQNGSMLSTKKDYAVSYKAGSNREKTDPSEASLGRNGGIIINNRDYMSISAKKVWNDNRNADGLRPTTITLHLLQDGKRMDQSYDKIVEDDGEGNWIAEWTQLPGGHTYSVEEDPIPGYEVTYEPAGGLTKEGLITVTNKDNRAQLNVLKKWVNSSGDEVDAPSNVSVTVQLLKNGVVVDTQTVSAPDWSYTWKLLDYDPEAIYTVVEDASKLPNGFEQHGLTYYSNIEPNASVTDKVMDGGTAVVENMPAEEHSDKIQVVVQKQWVDKEGNTLPASQVADKRVTVQLLKYKSEKVGTTVHFVDWSDSAHKDDLNVSAGNISFTTDNAIMWFGATNGGINSTNEWQAAVINGANSYKDYNGGVKSFSFSISDDTPDVYIYFKSNPGTINVTEYQQAQSGPADGPFTTGTTLTLTAPAFNGQFYNLDSTETDTESGITYNLSYAIEEIAVEGFTTQYSTDGETFSDSLTPVGGTGKKTITVKNTFIPVENEMSVVKNWVTKSGTEWPSGATVEVTLRKTVNGIISDVTSADLANSDQKQNPVILTASKTSTTWNHLPLVENVGGTDYEITYSVVEGTVTGVETANFITEMQTSNNGKNTIITNAEKVNVPVTKTWTEPLETGSVWTATFDLKKQKKLLLVNGVKATMNEIMAVEGVDEEGWSEAEYVMDGADNVSVTLTNADDTVKQFENLPVSESDASGNTYMLRYTVEESSLVIDDVPSLNMYSAEADNASSDNAYAGIAVTNTPITVDVPVEKAWDEFNAEGDWSARLRLQWAPIYEGDDGIANDAVFVDFEPMKEIIVTKEMMAQGDASLLQRTFAHLPKYGYDTVANKAFRYQYSVEEMAYTVTKGGTTYTFIKGEGEGVPDTYTPAGEENQFVPFYPHDGGERSEEDSDYYIQVSNHRRSTKDKKYLDLELNKTWSDTSIADMDDAYAEFVLKYNKRTDYRDISHMFDDDKTAAPITVTLKDISGKVYDTVHVQPHTGLRVGMVLLGRTGNISITASEGLDTVYAYYNLDKETKYFDNKAYPESSCDIMLSGDIDYIDDAWVSDTTPGNVSEAGVVVETIRLDKSNHWTATRSLLSQQTVEGGDVNNQNVEVYEYYLEETGCNPEGFDVHFLNAVTGTDEGDEHNTITNSSEIEARNEPKAKLIVKKAWRGVPNTKGYPPVYFTLYQCRPGAGMEENGKTIFQAEDGTTFENIELKHSDNPEEDYTWTCPITLPLRDSSGNRLAYYVIETPNSGTWQGTGWTNYGYSQAQDPVTFEYTHQANGDQPIYAQLVGNEGTLVIHNRVSDYHEMDIKKQYFMIKEDGSWFNVTADMTRNVVLGFKVIRRAVDPNDSSIHLSGWEDYGDEMLCGYGPSGEALQNNGTNDFWLQYAGLWHWTIHDMNNQQVHGHVGLPLTGFYTPEGETEPVTAKFQYSFRETNVYKDLQRTPYPDWEWYSTIVPDRYMNEQGGQVTGEFGLAFPNHDGERVANYQASDLLVTKRWIGEPNAKEVYVKIWRQPDNGGPLEDFTAEISKDIRGDYPPNHPAYGNSNWQGFLEDTTEIDATEGHEWLVLAAQPDGDWTSKMKIHNALIKTTGAGGWYTYYIEEVGYKDKDDVVHMKGDDPDPFVNLETHYTRWVGGKYGHWEVNPLTNGANKAISIGATGENKLQVMNAPRMDLTVNKEWFDINGDPCEPWRDSITFQIEQVATKWVQGAPTSETRTGKVKIDGQSTFTLSKQVSENKYYTLVDVSDHEGRHDTYNIVTDESAEKATAWTFYVDGLYEGYFDANNDEWHCVYTIKEVEVPKSEVIIQDNGVSSDGKTVTIENHYSETGSVKVTKTFSGIDKLPESFKITATWTDAEDVRHEIELKVDGELPENVTLDGDGSAENPYVWTISKIKIYPDGSSDKVVVTFKESGFEDADYTVTVSSSDSSVNKDYPVTTVEVSGEAVNRGDFNNEYDRISGGLKVVKKVTVNGGDTTGTLADGEYTFRLLESDQITQAKDKNGELVEDFSITITNGVADPIEIDNLIPGDYYVLEINGTNKAVTLDYEPKQVKVVANKTGDDIDAETGIATITNNLPTTVVKADKKWVDGNDAELENWPENAKATFGVFAGNSTTPLVTVELDGTPTPEESVPADGDTPAVEGIPADGDTPAAYEANKEGKESGGGLAIFKNLPQKDKNGNTIVYTIKEIGEPEGFKNETPDGVANGGTITNKQQDQKGALKLKKIVLVNGATPASAQANLVNGAYDFSVTGPIVQEETPEQDDTPDDTSKVIKFIRIVVWNNQMAFYQVADTQEELSRSSSSGWTPFSGNDAERWVLVENLEEGDYLITELGSHQVSNMGSDVYGFVEDKPVVSVSLYDISGGKDEEPDLGNGTVTVHVTNGDATASNAEAQVSYTNNYWSANIDILKIDETTRDQETSTPLSGAKFRLLKWDGLVPAGTEVNYVSYNESYGAEAGVEVNAQGKLEFDGLSDGEYKIVETKTPDGYIKTEVNDIYFKLEKGVVIRHSTPSVRTVTGTDVRSIEWGTVIAERERVAQVTYTKAQVASDDPAKDAEFIVGNTPGAKLPSTGGPGTTMIYVLGSIMTLLAAVLLITKRRTDGQGID